MPRRSQGARLYFKAARRGPDGRITHAGKWVIRDGEREVSTGSSDAAVAERALADYLARKRQPREEGRGGNPLVADVLAVYLSDKILASTRMKPARLREAKARILRLSEAFGHKPAQSLTSADYTAFAAERGKAARRDLEDLRAALNHAHAERLLSVPVPVKLPERYESRARWLTRSEMAKLILTAWRLRQEGSNRPTAKHIARFIVVAMYTGSRAGVVCGAAYGPATDRGYIDPATGMFYRLAPGVAQTKKRAPPIPMPPALLAHIRRWNKACIRERGRQLRAIVEWNGKPVGRINKGFRAVRVAAGFGEDVVPHTIRHSVVSWGLQNGADRFELGGYVGMSQETMERVYGHHDMERAARVVSAIMRKGTKKDRPGFAPDTDEHKQNIAAVNGG